MPNQLNFRSDVTNTTDPRYKASRLVRVPEEYILLEELPASFAFDPQDTVEVHFYTIPGNQLLLSTTITLSDRNLESHIVKYSDTEDFKYKNYIKIDFTELFINKNLILVPGDYRMVLNFFSDEIGGYDNRKLAFDQISDTRTEVQLSFGDTIDEVYRSQNLRLAKEFVEPGFTKPDAVGVAQKIFLSGVELNDPNEGVIASGVVDNINVPAINQTYENTIGRINNVNLRSHFNQKLNEFIPKLYSFIADEIFINGDERIQEDEYQNIIRKIVAQRLPELAGTLDLRITIT